MQNILLYLCHIVYLYQCECSIAAPPQDSEPARTKPSVAVTWGRSVRRGVTLGQKACVTYMLISPAQSSSGAI